MPRISQRAAGRFTSLAALVLLAACTDDVSPTGPVTPTPPAALADDALMSIDGVVSPAAATFTNLTYANRSPSERLDLYLPTTGTPPYPVVIWIHGGGWWSGDKGLPVGSPLFQLLKNGIAIASANYRLSTQAKFPAQIQDLKAVVRWLRANSTKYKLNRARIGAWGKSAGGHLAALLGTSGGVTTLTDLSLGNADQPEYVSAVVDFSGPVNFLTMDAQLKQLGCPPYNGTGHNAASSPPSTLMGAAIQTIPAKVATANPETYVTPNDPPFLIQHGSADCAVPYLQSRNLRNRLITVMGTSKVSYTIFSGAGHTNGPFFTQANMNLIVSWLKTRL